MKEFVIYPKRGRMILLGFLAFLFVLIGAVLIGIYFVEEDISIWMIVVGVVDVVFFGLCLIYYIKEINEHKPVLVISNEGIMDRSSYIGAGLVRWEDIADIDFVHFSGQSFLGIFTHDPELIINRTSSVKRMLNKLNKGLVEAQVNIPVKNLDCPVAELIEQINNYWKKHEDDAEQE